MRNMSEKTRGKKTKREIVGTIILCIMVLFSLLISVQIVVRGYANIFGFSFFRVVTGSMEPALPVNSLVISHKTNIEKIRVNDIVVFRSPTGTGADRIVTHRVVSVFWENGAATLETRGDANPVADGRLVRQKDMIGKVVWYTDKEGGIMGVMSFLSSKIGFLACIALPILLLGGLILRSCIVSIQKDLYRAQRELEFEEKQNEAECHVSHEEYEEIYDRIRAKLIEELKGNHEQKQQHTTEE